MSLNQPKSWIAFLAGAGIGFLVFLPVAVLGLAYERIPFFLAGLACAAVFWLAAAAMGMEVAVFFTFYGLNVIHKDFESKLRVSPLANPGMPMPVPMPELANVLPGMQGMATMMMKSMFKKKNVAGIRELHEVARESGVRMIACQMTMDVFGYGNDEFVDGVEFGGAAAFLATARRGHLTLFI